jgi:gliding motility-associated-like protein
MVKYDMKQIFRSSPYIANQFRNCGGVFIAVLFLSYQIDALGQKKCTNPPTLNLSSRSGPTCYLTPVTISDNTFGGSATSVTFSAEGSGSMASNSASSTPFSFTYIPDITDYGKVVTITVTTNNPKGAPCTAAVATYSLTVTSRSNAPSIDAIIQPTCTKSTGSVHLSGLPSIGAWTITVNPVGLTIQGSGTNTIINNLTPGTYTFTLSLASECISSPSAQAVILEQPPTPAPPISESITAPTCSLTTGSINLAGLPSSNWTLTRYPGTIETAGTGATDVISGLSSGSYYYTVTNEVGCISLLSGEMIIPDQPPIPSTPVIGKINMPIGGLYTGSVTLTGLPSTGTWTIIISPGEVAKTGSGITFTISDLEVGTYTFKVKNNSGCISPETEQVIIAAPGKPLLILNDPPYVCYPVTVDLTAPSVTEGSENGLTYTYWTDQEATTVLENPGSVSDGTFYIKGTSVSGSYTIKSVTVTLKRPAVANAGPDQSIPIQSGTTLEAILGPGETGTWVANSGNIAFTDVADPRSTVSNLAFGVNVLSWAVSNDFCPADTDKVIIFVGEIEIPTLITPNGDSKNEYFLIQGIENMGKTELTIFDRRGIMVFSNGDYDNKWNGVDYNGNPVVNDTYFYLLKSVIGITYKGYIVVKR